MIKIAWMLFYLNDRGLPQTITMIYEAKEKPPKLGYFSCSHNGSMLGCGNEGDRQVQAEAILGEWPKI